jgi:hypothetical protein
VLGPTAGVADAVGLRRLTDELCVDGPLDFEVEVNFAEWMSRI